MVSKVIIVVVIIIVAGLIVGSLAAFVFPSYVPRQSAFKMSTTDTVTNLDPALEYDLFSGTVVGNVFDTLYTTTPTNGTATPKTIPLLASGDAVPVGGDTSLWEVKLKKGLVFSNGDPITAEDVKFSFKRVEVINDPESASFYLTSLIDRNNVDGLITCPDGACDSTYTVHFKLNQTYSLFPNLLTFSTTSVINHRVFNGDATKKITGVGIPDGSGSGPYKVDTKSSDTQNRITLVANSRYNFPLFWKDYADVGAPSTAVPVSATFTIFVKSGAPALKADIQTHQVNLAYRSFNPQDIKGLQGDSSLEVHLGSSPQIRYMVFNVQKEPYNDPKVRQAIAYLVNRQEIVDAVFQGYAETLWSMIPPGWPGHKDVFQDVYGSSPNSAKARALLSGRTLPIPIELWYPTQHYGDTDIQVAQVLKAQLEKDGIFTVNLKSNVWAQYTKQFSRGELPGFLLGWFPDFADTDNYITPFLSTGGAKSLGSNYSDPQMDRLIANETGGPLEGRAQNFSRIQDKLAQDVPYLPVWQTGANAAFEKSVSGVILDPFLFRYFFIGKKTGAAGAVIQDLQPSLWLVAGTKD